MQLNESVNIFFLTDATWFNALPVVCVQYLSLTVVQRQRGTVYRLALGRSSVLGVGYGVVAASEAGSQLQTPHVANHSRGIKGLLQRDDTTQV